MPNIKSLYLIFIFIALTIGLVACLRSDQSLEKRLKASIETIEKRELISENKFRSRTGGDIFSALRAANAFTLKQPIIASAAVSQDINGRCDFVLTWIEEFPSIDSVEIDFGGAAPLQLISFEKTEKDEYYKIAKKVVYFTVTEKWETDSSVSSAISKIENSQQIRTRLLRNKMPVSNWTPVDLFRNGNWINNLKN